MPRKSKTTKVMRKNKKINKTKKMRGGVWYNPMSWFGISTSVQPPTTTIVQPPTTTIVQPPTTTSVQPPTTTSTNEQPVASSSPGGKSKKRVKRN